MKQFVKNILNEARVQRTIDPKIWASMSSASSKNRANLGVDVRPLSRDTKDVLVQKYVAGLLTMKVECPATEADIDTIKAYKLIGHGALQQGATLAEIQKLYVENGGTFDGPIEEPTSTETPDYPSYDEVDTEETTQSNEPDYPSYDEADIEEPESSDTEEPVSTETNDYPSYDEVKISEPVDSDKFANAQLIKNYIKGSNRILNIMKQGEKLCWDENGFCKDGVKIGTKVANAFNFVDNTSRFYVILPGEVALGNAGNNGVYDDYYFKTTPQTRIKHMTVSAGSNYYYDEESNGLFYTNILADNGNMPAQKVKEFSFASIVGDQVAKVFDKYVYLPTLPELTQAINMLPAGKYWTSSVKKNGAENIILQVGNDKVYSTSDPEETAKVVLFIKF